MKRLRDRVMRLGVPLFVEGPARRQSFTDLRDRLLDNSKTIQARLRSAQQFDQAEALVRHIVGIERWGSRRLEVALGKPLVLDRYQDHYPSQKLSPEGIMQLFSETRKQTVALLDRLEKTGYSEKIPHNGMGPLSVKGWLHYLIFHADLESRKIR